MRIADLPDDITIPTREAFVDCLTKTQNRQARSYYRRSDDGATCAAGDFLCVLVAMNPHQWRWEDIRGESPPVRHLVPRSAVRADLRDPQRAGHRRAVRDAPQRPGAESKPRIAEILEAAHKRFGHDLEPGPQRDRSTLITWYQDTYRLDYEPEWGTYSANPSEPS